MEGGGTQSHCTQTSDLARHTQPERTPLQGRDAASNVCLFRPDVCQCPRPADALTATHTHTHTHMLTHTHKHTHMPIFFTESSTPFIPMSQESNYSHNYETTVGATPHGTPSISMICPDVGSSRSTQPTQHVACWKG